MSTPPNVGELNEEETQDIESQEKDREESRAEQTVEPVGENGPHTSKKTRIRKEPVTLVREAGKSLLPFSRVQKIIKADKDIPIIAKDATFLISLATEEFIMRLCEAGKRVAERERRTTVQHKDIATVVRKADEFLFLEEIIPWMAADPPVRRKPQGEAGTKVGPTMLDQFVVSSRPTAEEGVAEQADIVMNENGTMGVVGGEMDDFE
ncbi:hypothetical protein FPV67DRAFT_760259 [Lyophyllum atratum]|nr:hypothetical protein FPV67DRAFT_760259 [Lyophyllum atratum]